jgi:prephenate dehydrogenase
VNRHSPVTRTAGPVRVVGTGLLGASIGLGLATRGVDVVLADPSPSALALARDLGAGRLPQPEDAEPALVVVAAPPDVTAAVVAAELAAHPAAVVTDVASVKAGLLAELTASGADLSRYVAGHPLAGRERSGAVAARGDLFAGRPWVLSPAPASRSEAAAAVRDLVLDLGATPVTMDAAEHDEAVALVSHTPQVAASLVAARLRQAGPEAVALAGQGLRDVTRIAASDPGLWVQILAANAAPVAAVLRGLRDDLDDVLTALEQLACEGRGAPAPGARTALARAIAAGNEGRARIPGKHGSAPTTYAVVTVVVPDRPGQLGRLFGDMGEVGVNLEDLHLEHSPGQPVGLAELAVLPAERSRLETALRERGWTVHG